MIASLTLILSILAGIILVIVLRGASSLSLLDAHPNSRRRVTISAREAVSPMPSWDLSILRSALPSSRSCWVCPSPLRLQKEYLGRRLAWITRLSLDILWGTPSIVYGAFGFIVMVYLGFSASLLGGIIALSLLMLPIMIRSIEEVIRMIPPELKEISYALGATRIETTLNVVLRQALPGIVTGILLAFGRGIGDAASILFTAGYTDYIPRSLFDPVASLPLAVFFQVATPIPEVQERAYASALILLVIVLWSVLSRDC